MELEIVAKRENPLLKRIEVTFRVAHGNEATPTRANLRQELAKVLHATKDIVIVDHTKSEWGRSASKGYAKVYKSKEDALRSERKHTLVRNGLLERQAKAEKPAAEKPAPPPRKEKEEAPKAEKAPPKPEAPKPAAEKEPKHEKKEEKPAEKKEAKAEKPAKGEGKKAPKEGK